MHKDVVALVTGSSRGIGSAIVDELARVGIAVVINYDTHEAEAMELRDKLRNQGGRVDTVQADVSDRQQVQAMIAHMLKVFDHVDIVVNNAGITCDKTLKNMSYEDWDRVLAVNLSGVFNVTKEALPSIMTQGGGSIVNIASIIGQTGAFGQANYAASKAGIIGFTKACALEMARHNVTVNAICPGFVETDMLRDVPPEVLTKIVERVPLRRLAQPVEIARLVRFLVTEGNYITGQCININGGLLMT